MTHRHPRPNMPPFGRISRSRRRVPLLALVLLGACDFIPTDAPRVEQLWALPIGFLSITAEDLAPAGMTVANDQFVVNIPATTASTTLQTLCPACPSGNGVAVPAFAATFTATRTSNDSLNSALTAASTFPITITNGLGFDPLRTGNGGVAGRIITSLASNGVVIAADTAAGPGVTLPSGGTLNRTLTLPAGRMLANQIELRMRVEYPGGGTANLAPTQTLSATLGPSALRMSSVIVSVERRGFASTPDDLDVADVDSTVTSKVRGGTVKLRVTNPWNLAGAVAAQIVVPGGPTITKVIGIPASANDSLVVFSLTAEEIESILGNAGVTLQIAGLLDSRPTGTPVTLLPAQRIEIRPTFEILLEVGGDRR
jgi:hypothetical protein